MAEAAAPGGQDARHARRHRAVHDRRQGQRHRRDRDRAPDPDLADVGIPRPRRRPRDAQRVLRCSSSSRRRCSRPASCSRTSSSCRRRVDVPDELRRRPLQRPDPGELLPVVHLARAARLRARVRDADLHPRARPDPRAQLRQAAPQPAARLRADGRVRDPAADRRPRLARCSRRSRCSILFEVSIWLSVLMERRWERAAYDESLDGRCETRRVTIVSADWVVPVEGDAGRGRCGRDRRRRHDRGRRAAAELGRGERFDGCVIIPGLVNAHSHIEYAVYAGFGDGLPFVPWIGMHIERKGPRPRGDGGDRERRRRRMPALGGHDDRRLQLRRRGGDRAATTGLRAIVFLEVFGRDASGARPVPRDPRAGRAGCSPIGSGSASRRTRRTRARSSSTRRAPTLGLPIRRRTSRRASPSARGSSTGPATGSRSRVPVAAAGRDGDPRARRSRAARPGPAGRPLRPRRRRGDRAARRARRGRRALPTLERLSSAAASRPSRSCGRPGSRSASPPTARRRRRRSTCSTRSAPPSSARGRAAGRPDALTRRRRARAGDARRRARARSRRRDRLARPRQAGRPGRRLARGSPFDPVEDPVTAVVLGGSPDRVTATLVAGEERYRKGTTEWPDSRRAARRARSRMLP